jgi:hypothetical protein
VYKCTHKRNLARTNIAVDQKVANDLSEEARKENKTLYALANESLLATLEVTKAGGIPNQIEPAWKFVRMMKDVDCIAIPGDLLEKLIARLHGFDRDWLLDMWKEEGLRLGEYLKMSAINPEDLGEIIDEFQLLLPAHRITFDKSNSSSGEQFIMRAVGAGQSLESTKCGEQFIHGVFAAYSLEVTDSSISKGIIEVKARARVPNF